MRGFCLAGLRCVLKAGCQKFQSLLLLGQHVLEVGSQILLTLRSEERLRESRLNRIFRPRPVAGRQSKLICLHPFRL